MKLIENVGFSISMGMENRAFRKRCSYENPVISLFCFLTHKNPKWPVILCVLLTVAAWCGRDLILRAKLQEPERFSKLLTSEDVPLLSRRRLAWLKGSAFFYFQEKEFRTIKLYFTQFGKWLGNYTFSFFANYENTLYIKKTKVLDYTTFI